MIYPWNVQENNEKQSYLNKIKPGMSNTEQSMFTFIEIITARNVEENLYCKYSHV